MNLKYAYTNGIILDGTKNMTPLTNKVLLTNDTIIEGIFDNSISLEGYEIIDLKGKYLLPGLIDLHVHLAGSGKPKNNSADAKRLVSLITSNALTNFLGKKMVANYAKQQLYSGTTTIRTVGGITNYDTSIRNKINAGKCVGPRILASNMAVSVPGGHMAGSLAYEATTPEEAVAFVDTIAKDQPDLIKLMITGGVSDAEKIGEPGILRMPPEIVKAACTRAHELGYKVAAHVESPEGVEVALENGVDTIEHGAMPNEKIIDLFKEKKAAHVATISPTLPFVLFKRELPGITDVMKANGKIVYEGGIELAKRCLENNILVGLGNDTACPFVTQYDMWRELAYFVAYCGVSNAFAIHTATLVNAKIAGVSDITGSLEAGKSADMIVVSENPLEDITTLRNVHMVVMAGKQYFKKVKKMKEVEEELDQYLP